MRITTSRSSKVDGQDAGARQSDKALLCFFCPGAHRDAFKTSIWRLVTGLAPPLLKIQ